MCLQPTVAQMFLNVLSVFKDYCCVIINEFISTDPISFMCVKIVKLFLSSSETD